MEPNVVKEVETLKQMARNWLRGYKTWIEPCEDNDYVYEEFFDEIYLHLVPYLKRLEDTEHLTHKEAEEVVKYFGEQVVELRKYANQR